MTRWSPQELDSIAAADELELAPVEGGGKQPSYTTIWVVRVGDDLYVRSYRGAGGSWHRTAVRSHGGRIRAGGVERDVGLEEAAGVDREAIDAAYRRKYGRSAYVHAMVTTDAASTTLRLVPR